MVDEWQGRGLGTVLCSLLAERAREEGVERFTALLLAEQRADARRARLARPVAGDLARRRAPSRSRSSSPRTGSASTWRACCGSPPAATVELATPPVGAAAGAAERLSGQLRGRRRPRRRTPRPARRPAAGWSSGDERPRVGDPARFAHPGRSPRAARRASLKKRSSGAQASRTGRSKPRSFSAASSVWRLWTPRSDLGEVALDRRVVDASARARSRPAPGDRLLDQQRRTSPRPRRRTATEPPAPSCRRGAGERRQEVERRTAGSARTCRSWSAPAARPARGGWRRGSATSRRRCRCRPRWRARARARP